MAGRLGVMNEHPAPKPRPVQLLSVVIPAHNEAGCIASTLEHLHLELKLQKVPHEIVAVELTPDDVGDISVMPDLLDQIDVQVASMTADGAYDGQVVYDAVTGRHPKAAVIVPPRITAISVETTATQRDKHLATIAEHGRISWQRSSGYNRRSLVETTMFRYKTITGRRLHARTLSNQKTEVRIGCAVLKRMTSLGMPVSVRFK